MNQRVLASRGVDAERLGSIDRGRLRTFLAAARSSLLSCSRWPTSRPSTGELSAIDAERYLDLAAASFALSTDPVDRAWYGELERVSAVAADIGGVSTTHINHLTARVLDIDDLDGSMQDGSIDADRGADRNPAGRNGADRTTCPRTSTPARSRTRMEAAERVLGLRVGPAAR